MWMACPANAVLISSFYNIDNLDNIVKPGHCPTAPFTTWSAMVLYVLVLVVAVLDVLVRSRVPIFLRQPKVNNVDLVCLLPQAHKKVVWLNVSVNHVAPAGFVQHFESCNELREEQKGRLQAEFSTTHVE